MFWIYNISSAGRPPWRAVREHLLGLPLLLLTVALAFGVLGLGSWAVGGVL
ncbi:hypothetical protein [Frigoribacterium sp. Leaf164]|uniref:hypothetical protein n=1 Tax=Frigoribacterium sp. Leaf164 TaxID=1736282 RepID=UPI000A9E334B|nr:hypothetical protein [Frigoribacterium sp. Leaf164]